MQTFLGPDGPDLQCAIATAIRAGGVITLITFFVAFAARR